MRLVFAVALFFSFAGCLGSTSPGDASANFDLETNFDLGNTDLAGAYNCSQLNDCEQKCKHTMCAACREMATPQAVAKELALQSCFNQYCPQKSDMSAPICAPDPTTGMFSTACMTCVANTQAASSTSCNPTGAPECTRCFTQVQACKNDI